MIGVSVARCVSVIGLLHRSKTHLSTREFSPYPGHRNRPSAFLRNQFT